MCLLAMISHDHLVTLIVSTTTAIDIQQLNLLLFESDDPVKKFKMLNSKPEVLHSWNNNA